MSDTEIEMEESEESYFTAEESLEAAGYESPVEGACNAEILEGEWDSAIAHHRMDWPVDEEVRRILAQIGSLPKMAATIRAKTWHIPTIELVAWIVAKRRDGRSLDRLPVLERKQVYKSGDVRTKWYLFGGPYCQIGKTFVAAVGSVAAANFGISHLVFTYTASACVPDLQAKIEEYLSSPHDAHVTSYRVKSFPRGSKTGLEFIRENMQNTTWVVSFNSIHQLETAAALRLALARSFGSTRSDSRPLVTADEVDQMVRTRTRSLATEQRFDAVLGMFRRCCKVQSAAKREHLCGNAEDVTYRLPPVLAVVATTSTPVTFLWQFAIDLRRHRWDLDGWIIPDGWQNYAGIIDYLATTLRDGAVGKSNKYIFDNEGIILNGIERAIDVGRNQIVYNGNPYVVAADGLYDMVRDLEGKVTRPDRICYLIVHGKGRSIKMQNQDWVDLPKKTTIKEALNIARTMIKDGTIFVCGTSPMISRGISMVSMNENTGDGFLYPPTLIIMTTPLGRALEEYYQGLNRGTGDFLASIRQLQQVEADTGHPYVELIAAQGDWLGCQAYPRYVLSIYNDFRYGGKTIKEALLTPKNLSEDFIAQFRENRVVPGRKTGKVRKCQGDIEVRVPRIPRGPRSPRGRHGTAQRRVEGQRPRQLQQALQAFLMKHKQESISKACIEQELQQLPGYSGWFANHEDKDRTLHVFRQKGWLKFDRERGRNFLIITQHFPRIQVYVYYRMLCFLDLFTGSGAASYALSQAGLAVPMAYCDTDEYVRGNLARLIAEGHLPAAPIISDVRLVKADSVSTSIDFILAGSPCTGHSIIGRQKGFKDPDSALFYDMVTVVRVIKPKFIILENTPLILKRDQVRAILQQFTQIGYDRFQWTVVPAYAVGSPQTRKRWFCVIYNLKAKSALAELQRKLGIMQEDWYRSWLREPVPRLTQTRQENYTKRCKMLGNAIVPAQLVFALKALTRRLSKSATGWRTFDKSANIFPSDGCVLMERKIFMTMNCERHFKKPNIDLHLRDPSPGAQLSHKQLQLWPTPRANNCAFCLRLTRRCASDLPSAIRFEENSQYRAGDRVNLSWLEWLMGLPIGWTKLR